MFNLFNNDIMKKGECSQMKLGKTILELRKQSGMTQEELANRLGVTAQAVSKWENDISCPDISLLPELAKLFSITIDELLCGAEDNKADEAEEGAGCKASPPEAKTEENCSENPPPEGESCVKKTKLKHIKIRIIRQDGKSVNVKLPVKIINFGLGIGGIFGGLNEEQTSMIRLAVENNLAGEILNLDTENGENIIISLE